uniref:Putative hemolymph juvenile hormone binding protein n=1 Tax=Corethrella appendiculata TaxID=1370023 RepID=U5ETV6_9DIPT
MFFKLQFLIIFNIFLEVFCVDFPNDIHRCHIGDNNCVTNEFNRVFQNFENGHIGLNLKSLDPLKIEKMDIVQGGDSPVNIVLNFTNVDFNGLRKAKVHSISGFVSNPKKMEVRLKAPVLSLIGNYKINGRVLILPIAGVGKSNMTMENIEIQLRWIGKLIEKKDKKFYNIDKFRASFDTTLFIMNFSNLFNGDRALGDNMNKFLNENWKDILNEVKPSIVTAFAKIFKNLVNNVFETFPYNELFI